MPSAVARLWITSRMSARSKLSTIASSSPSGRSDSGAGSVGAAGFCAHAGGPASTAVTLTIANIHCPFTACSSLLRKGSGLVDAPGRWLGGANAENPHCPAYRPRSRKTAASKGCRLPFLSTAKQPTVSKSRNPLTTRRLPVRRAVELQRVAEGGERALEAALVQHEAVGVGDRDGEQGDVEAGAQLLVL